MKFQKVESSHGHRSNESPGNTGGYLSQLNIVPETPTHKFEKKKIELNRQSGMFNSGSIIDVLSSHERKTSPPIDYAVTGTGFLQINQAKKQITKELDLYNKRVLIDRVSTRNL